MLRMLRQMSLLHVHLRHADLIDTDFLLYFQFLYFNILLYTFGFYVFELSSVYIAWQIINCVQKINNMIFQKIYVSAFKNIFTNRFFRLTNTCTFSSRKTVLLFGGQGNQEKGMLDKFLFNNEALSIIKEESDKLKVDLLQIATTDSNNRINVTSYTQPLLLLSQYLQILYGQKKIDLSQQNKSNTYCIGHSLGEYTSLLISGSLSLSQCLRLVYARGSLMIKSSQGQSKLGTLIIKFREDKLDKILQQTEKLKLEISCYNSPTNIVVSGEIDSLTELKNYMKSQLRIVSKVLPAATAFHSTHLLKMKDQFEKILETVDFQTPKLQILRNLDCKFYESKIDIVEGLVMQNTNPVLFRQSVDSLLKMQGKQNLDFIEIGHKEYLTRWVDEVKKLY